MSSPTSSDSLYTSHSIPSSLDYDGSIKCFRRPTVIDWAHPDGQCYLQDVELHMRYLYPQRKACLKLTVRIHLDEKKRAPQHGTVHVIYINPQHIKTLSYEIRALPSYVSKRFKHPVCLKFTMLEAPCVLVPEGDCRGANDQAQKRLDRLHSFASQMSFYIYFDQASQTLPRGKLKAFCKEVSRQGVQRYDYEYLEPHVIWKGKGGRIFNPSISSHEDIPPPYSASADRKVLNISPTDTKLNKRRLSQIDTESDTESDSKTDANPSASCPVLGTAKRHRGKAPRQGTPSSRVDELPAIPPVFMEMVRSVIQMMVREEVKNQLEVVKRQISEKFEELTDSVHQEVDNTLETVGGMIDDALEDYTSKVDDNIYETVPSVVERMFRDGSLDLKISINE